MQQSLFGAHFAADESASFLFPFSARYAIIKKVKKLRRTAMDGVWRIYVDSSDYYNPVPDDFQVYIGSV